jgi:hypothetical protein
MNSKYKSSPELIAAFRTVDHDGEEKRSGDKVVGVMCQDAKTTPIIQLDIREFSKNHNLIIEIEAAELMAALTQAMINAQND